MQTTFKLKLQNALNSVNFTDADSPALIVGGRRRNRKKRRTRYGHNKRKNKKGDNCTETPAETPEPSRKSFINRRETQPPKVSCLDIEEPVFAVSPKAQKDYTQTGIIKDAERNNFKASEAEDFLYLENTDTNHLTEGFETIDHDDVPETYGYENSESKRGLPRHHSEDSGVFDDEEDLVQQSLGTVDDDDSALRENDADCPEIDPGGETGPSEIADESVHDERIHEIADQETEQAAFEEVPIDDGDEEDDAEDVIFDLTDLKNKTLEDGDYISPTDETFQLKSLSEPTDLEDEIPERISLDLLSDDDDDVVLFDAGSQKEPAIICNPLYEQSLKEEQDAQSARSYQVGFKPDFDTVNFIRLPATDKAAKKEMKESSPLISKQSGDELPCCVIL